MTRGRRAVILVGGPAKPYSRATRIARTLVAEGYEVEIAAITATGAPDEEREGPVVIRRYRPTGRFAGMATAHTVAEAAAAPGAAQTGERPGPVDGPAPAGGAAGRRRPPWRRVAGRLRRLPHRARKRGRAFVAHLLWPVTVRAWWATLADELDPADLYHACGTLTIAPALAAAARDRRAGRSSSVIYDAVDNTFEGNNVIGMPRLLRRLHAWRERRWARAADARITVNEALARRLASRWGVPPLAVVPNWPEPPESPSASSDRIRETLGLPPTTRIVLFQGRLSPNLGLDEAAEAVLLVERACLVLLGFGRRYERERERDRDPRFAGRHFTLPAVHPDELAEWTASADVSLVTLPPVSTNQRDSTPNKFWESLLVGTPVVLGPGLDLMARIVDEAGAGVVASSLEPAALAAAIGAVLDADPGESAERRSRIAAHARARFTWPRAAAVYAAVVRRIEGDAPEPTAPDGPDAPTAKRR